MEYVHELHLYAIDFTAKQKTHIYQIKDNVMMFMQGTQKHMRMEQIFLPR